VLDDDDETLEMLVDIALFEPNQRGRLAFDTFYLRQGQQLDAADRLLAGRMTAAVFSLFRHAGKHEVAGIWLEDLLDQDRRLWLMDEALEQSGRAGMVFGMRLFDAGPFHAGFGIVAPPDEETIAMCVIAKRRDGRVPFRYSLAATLYGDKLRAKLPFDAEQEQIVQALLDSLGTRLGGGVAGGRPKAARKRRPPRGRS